MVGIKMATGRQPEFFMLGSSQFRIGSKSYAADIGASVVATGMSIDGTLKGTIDVHGMKLSNLSVMGSVNWAGVPGIGFDGKKAYASYRAKKLLKKIKIKF